MLSNQVLKMCNTFKIKGEYASRSVYINGKEIYPDYSICPDGFCWGRLYKQTFLLAISLIKEITGDYKAAMSYYNIFYFIYLENVVGNGDFEFTFVYTDWLKAIINHCRGLSYSCDSGRQRLL